MFRFVSLLLGCAVAWLVLITPRGAAAQDNPVLVVDVTHAASELDAAQLRVLIGKDLQAEAVSPDDPRASSARGTVTVDIDRKTGELLVSYLARNAPTSRRVPLPSDQPSAQNAAVVLASNLSRDEASEIAAELRKQRPPESAPKPSPPKPKASIVQNEAYERQKAEAARLEQVLEYHAQQERRAIGFGVVSLAAGLASLTISSPFLSLEGRSVSARVLEAAGWELAAIGGYHLAHRPYKDLVAIKRVSSRAATEEAWARIAREEHLERRLWGHMGLIGTGLLVAGGVFSLTYGALSDGDSQRPFAAGLFGSAAVFAVASVYRLTTEGPAETGLHAYERSTGRSLVKKDAVISHLTVAPVPGGAMGSLTMTF